MVSRIERTRFAAWWWTVDRPLLAAVAVLMLIGIVLSLAASPAVASRIGVDAFHFVNRHAMFLAPAFVVMIATSFLAPRQIRHLALVVFALSVALVMATLVLRVAAGGTPPQALHGSVVRRYVPGDQRDGILHPRRLVRPRTGRGHRETGVARQPCGFRVRGGGGGIRHRALPRAGRAVRLCR